MENGEWRSLQSRHRLRRDFLGKERDPVSRLYHRRGAYGLPLLENSSPTDELGCCGAAQPARNAVGNRLIRPVRGRVLGDDKRGRELHVIRKPSQNKILTSPSCGEMYYGGRVHATACGMGEWAAFLRRETTSQEADMFRFHERTNRPLGSDEFLARLEIMTGWRHPLLPPQSPEPLKKSIAL